MAEKLNQSPDQLRVKIGIQKSGKLTPDSLTLLEQAGLNVGVATDRLSVVCRTFNAEVVFLRDDDIQNFVRRRALDLGIIGQNLLQEFGTRGLDQLLELGFGKCALTVAVPEDSPFQTIDDLEGKKVATSYPRSTRRFFREREVNAKVLTATGSIEVTPKLGFADAISDLVSSGNTLEREKLRPLESIFASQAILIGSEKIPKQKKEEIEELLMRFKGVIDAKEYTYLVMNAPAELVDGISRICPGLTAPTVIPIATEGWVSIHVVIPKSAFWDKVRELKAIGVTGIAETEIKRIIF